MLDLAELLPRAIWEPNSGCLLWEGATDTGGYAKIRRSGKTIRVHRAVYEAKRGPLAPGECALHRCDTRACINEAHLFAGTRTDNSADMVAKGRGRSRPKLTEAEVIAVRAASGTHRAIAAAFGIGKTQVGRIKRAERWRRLFRSP